MALLLVVVVAAAVPGVLRARQERRLGGAASVLAGARVAVRCQSFGGAFVDAGPELGYVRWRADSGRLGEALMPDGYRSPDCRAGGPWTSGWPAPRGLRRHGPKEVFGIGRQAQAR